MLPFVIVGGMVGGIAGWLIADRFIPQLRPWIAIIFAAGAAFYFWPNRQTTDAYLIGAVGEERVGRELAKLPHGYYVFHDIKIPGSKANIDHLVIGPTGVFIVETKAVTGKVTLQAGSVYLNGRKRNYVEQAWREAVAVQKSISELAANQALDVHPLLCFTRAELPIFQTDIEGVALLGPKGVRRHISKSQATLAEEHVAEIVTAASRTLPLGIQN